MGYNFLRTILPTHAKVCWGIMSAAKPFALRCAVSYPCGRDGNGSCCKTLTHRNGSRSALLSCKLGASTSSRSQLQQSAFGRGSRLPVK
jgi:hypothetical protein